MNVEETHDATVTSIDDPEKRGRIQVACPGLMGSDDDDDVGGQLPMWVEPIYQWGWFVVPDVGETVEIVVQCHGDDDESFKQSSIESLNPRWRGGRYWTTPDNETAREVPTDFTSTNYGKRRGLATPQGHIILFDDTEDKEKVSITWHGIRAPVTGGPPADAYSFFSLDEDGSVLISNRNGSLIYMNAQPDVRQVVLVDEHGNSITMDADGIRLIDLNSNIVDLNANGIQAIGQGGLSLSSGGGTSLDGGAVYLGTPAAAVDFALLGTTFVAALTTFNTTIQTAAGVASAAVIEPLLAPFATSIQSACTALAAALANVLSQKVYVE